MPKTGASGLPPTKPPCFPFASPRVAHRYEATYGWHGRRPARPPRKLALALQARSMWKPEFDYWIGHYETNLLPYVLGLMLVFVGVELGAYVEELVGY